MTMLPDMDTPDVFISYSSKDQELALAVVAKLKERGVIVWIAALNAPAGEFAGAVVPCIRGAKLFLLLLSQHSLASRNVLSEIDLAFNAKRTILPVRLDDTPLPNEHQYYLGASNALKLDQAEPDWATLWVRVASVLDRPVAVPCEEPQSESSELNIQRKGRGVKLALGILGVFALLFTLGFVHQYIVERQQYRLFVTALDRLELQENRFVYNAGAFAVEYDLREGVGGSGIRVLRDPKSGETGSGLRVPVQEEIAEMAGYTTAGTAATVAIVTVWNNTRGRGRIVAVATTSVAVVTGYGLGRYVAAKWLPSFGSEAMVAYLARPDVRRDLQLGWLYNAKLAEVRRNPDADIEVENLLAYSEMHALALRVTGPRG